MGMFRKSCIGSVYTKKPEEASAPNPEEFRVMRTEGYGGKSVVLEVYYPQCNNYEGRKILVFKTHRHIKEFAHGKTLDPHFNEHDPALVARFQPTELGWAMANDLACKLGGVL